MRRSVNLQSNKGLLREVYDNSGNDEESDYIELAPIGQENRSATDFPADPLCGWGRFRPPCLQGFRTPRCLLCALCLAGLVQGMIVNGFVTVDITTIERRFGLSSSSTGLITSGYDLASLLCLIPVTYIGGRLGASKPLWLGCGILILGLGSFVFAVPHFLNGIYRGNDNRPTVCVPGTEGTYERGNNSMQHLTRFRWVFFVGQFLHGMGTSPLYTLGVTCIDDIVSKSMSSVYLGTFYSMAIIGTALGYVAGGQLLAVFTDSYSVDPQNFGLAPSSNAWIGAWWIGFLVAGVACLMLAVLLLAFPARMPGAARIKAERVSEAHFKARLIKSQTGKGKLPDLPRAILNLLKNPTFCFLNLAAASEGFIASGFCAFLPKFLENQFQINPTKAALLMGMITVPAGGGGTFLGGYLVQRFNLRCASILKFCLCCTLLGAAFTTAFLFSCPNQTYAGITTLYVNATTFSLDHRCNAGCGCSRQLFDPVCGMDHMTYYSACYAGCTAEIPRNNLKFYRNCTCIEMNRDTTSASHTTTNNLPDALQEFLYPTYAPEFEALNRKCESACHSLLPFIVLIFGVMFFTFICSMPALTASLRCVQDEERSFALGLQWLKVRVVGTIPAPLLFGALIDRACLQWQDGTCLVFDNAYMSYYMMVLAFVGKSLGVVGFLFAWMLYEAPVTVESRAAFARTFIDDYNNDVRYDPDDSVNLLPREDVVLKYGTLE